MLSEVQIFDPEAHAFHEAQATAIQEFGHHLMFIGHVAQDGLDFGFGEHHREMFGLFGVNDVGQRPQLLPEKFAIEKQDGAEGLTLGGSGHVLVNGQVGEERGDFGSAHVFGMALIMKDAEREAFDPIVISVFGAAGIMLDTHGVAELVEEGFRNGGGGHSHYPAGVELRAQKTGL